MRHTRQAKYQMRLFTSPQNPASDSACGRLVAGGGPSGRGVQTPPPAPPSTKADVVVLWLMVSRTLCVLNAIEDRKEFDLDLSILITLEIKAEKNLSDLLSH